MDDILIHICAEEITGSQEVSSSLGQAPSPHFLHSWTDEWMKETKMGRKAVGWMGG